MVMMYYNQTKEHVLNEVKSNEKTGLSSDEARDRLERDGKNELVSVKNKSIIRLFFEQLNDVLIYVLLGAAILTLIASEYADTIIIVLVVLINAAIGVFQEHKAEKAVEALKNMSTPKALVKRDGAVIEIDSKEVCVGDIVILDAGRFVPADIRLIESSNLQIEESALTGESVASEKDAFWVSTDEKTPLGDQINMAFQSTLVTYGRGVGVVISTGMKTEMGKIASILQETTNELTPLQKRLEELGKVLGIIALTVCVIIFGLGLIQGNDPMEMFVTAISLAVAAIPEGLAAIVAIVLALGVTRMSKKNAIVKKLPAVETLGSVNVICSDKTGTLTQNKMTVTTFYTYGKKRQSVSDDLLSDDEKLMQQAFILSSDASIKDNQPIGDPTEVALVELGKAYQMEKETLEQQMPRVAEYPFDSTRKRMSTIVEINDRYHVYTKGAVDQLLSICDFVLSNGKKIELTKAIKDEVLEMTLSLSNEALRVLGVAYKESNQILSNEEMEQHLVFIGLVGMIDPPRLEVKDSIKLAKQAGIKVVMITGDHKNTAFAIAKELGIAESLEQCMTGQEFDLLTEEERVQKVNQLSVFARVSPNNKVEIVKAFKANDNIVSMTGDGVNDAPSLKSADIGVAMGITGTDVSKGASDMILTDDNFSTIVEAIEEGRNIYNNIKKAVIFLLSCNLGEIVAIFLAVLLGWPVPLLATQILWINLITDTLPAISLGIDPGDKGVMLEKPRSKKESFFAHGATSRAVTGGLLIGLTTLLAFVIGLLEQGVTFANISSVSHGDEAFIYASTMAFVVLAVSQLFYSFTMRNEKKSILAVGIFSNTKLVGSLVIGVLLQLIVIGVPFLQNAFGVTMLEFADFIYVFTLALIPVLINELLKLVTYLKTKK